MRSWEFGSNKPDRGTARAWPPWGTACVRREASESRDIPLAERSFHPPCHESLWNIRQLAISKSISWWKEEARTILNSWVDSLRCNWRCWTSGAAWKGREILLCLVLPAREEFKRGTRCRGQPKGCGKGEEWCRTVRSSHGHVRAPQSKKQTDMRGENHN